jgi:hypothetical protein
LSAPKKTKINEKGKYLNARGVDLYLLRLRRSSFHPLKLPDSTLLAKGYFWLFCQFSNYNDVNELPYSIYRLFWLFLLFFGLFCHFFGIENHLMWFLSFSLDVTTHFTFGLETVLGDGSL